jgi:hypothetical protein
VATVVGAADVRTGSLVMTTRDNAMFYQVIAQCTQALKNLETWLDKAEQHAALRKYDIGVDVGKMDFLRPVNLIDA